MKETKSQLKVRSQKILKLLKKEYPEAHCALIHKNAFELLIATILSAQCTDERVNQVTPLLFQKFPTPQKMAKASLQEIEVLVFSTGFYKNKAKNIQSCCRDLVSRFHGEVPSTMEELTTLAGVGRKTANVILGNIFEVPSMVVDTHVTRVSNRMGFVKGKNAVQLERDLQKLIPESDWTGYSHYIIFHGRQICTARKPQCHRCMVKNLCPKIGVP